MLNMLVKGETKMKTEREKMINGERYDPGDRELMSDRARARTLVRSFNDARETEEEERSRLLKALFGSTGETIYAESNFRCDYGYNIDVEENFYANFDCTILDEGKVTIGKNCMIAPGVHIYTNTHPIHAEERITEVKYTKPVAIGDNVWMGGRAVINPGVSVGDNAVIASGAVVTKDVPANAVVGGNPASVIRSL